MNWTGVFFALLVEQPSVKSEVLIGNRMRHEDCKQFRPGMHTKRPKNRPNMIVRGVLANVESSCNLFFRETA